MIVRKLVFIVALLALGAMALPALADDAPAARMTSAAVPDSAAAAGEDAGPALVWKDYKVKGYSLSLYGGRFSGATYLDLMPLGPRTILTPGAGDIIAYDGSVLIESVDMQNPNALLRHYNAPRKEIEAGTAFGGRIGIYVAEDFHLDLIGNYMSGRALTTMLYNPDSTNPANEWTRVEVDEDTGFRAFKGGVSLMYDARPATFLGATPLIGFGLGGIINRYSVLEDKTALYLEGNFGLSFQPMDDLKIIARADLAVFAYEVDELGYSNMVSYKNFTVGAAWFIDTVPAEVRAEHNAARTKKIRR
jgi:hypothetical protein